MLVLLEVKLYVRIDMCAGTSRAGDGERRMDGKKKKESKYTRPQSLLIETIETK